MKTVAVHALNGVSLEIKSGCFSAIVGPSGSGKTTLLHMIGCIDRPTEGEIEVCGEKVLRHNDNQAADFRSRNISFIFQNFNLIPVLTAYENVEYPLLLLGVPASKRKQKTLAVLEAVGLADRITSRPNQLSGGQKQRVAIARALVKEPQIVLADEPTANLDSKTSESIVELMRNMQKQFKTTFIFSTHDQNLIKNMDELFHIRDGRLET